MQRKVLIRRVAAGLLVISLFLALSAFVHPYYICVTEIRVNSAQRTVSLSCKMFNDDLQNTLTKLYKTNVDIVKHDAKCDSLLDKYVHERVELWVGGKKIAFKFVGYEIEQEATWCYFDGDITQAGKTVKLSSSILYDFLELQTNFVHCYYDGVKKSYKLDNPNTVAAFDFGVK